MSHKPNLAFNYQGCANAVASKGGDERWRRAILDRLSGLLSHGFPVRSPDPPLRLRFPLPPSRKRWDKKSVTGHGPTCGMRMLNFLFLQASQRRLKAARRPKSGVYRHPPSEFLLPPPPSACNVACHVARPMGQLIAAIGSDIYIDAIRIDAHGLACAQHAAFVAPETPRNGGFGRPPPLGFCQSDWPRARA